MTVDVELLYRQHLTGADRRALHGFGADRRDLTAVLADPGLEAALFEPVPDGSGPYGSGAGVGRVPAGVGGAEGRLAGTSPFLTFAVAVHRTAARLEVATYVEERWAPRRKVPVFDVTGLRSLLAPAGHRLFLVELLASYTHVASGVTWQHTSRGWRRRRFSELDPVRLAELLEAVPTGERAGVYRRLGDLALFLVGVFPDHTGLGPASLDRLLRLAGIRADYDDRPSPPDLLEALGRRWYQAASASARAPGVPATDQLRVVGEMGRRFADARRVLNVVTDWYLFPARERWFGRA